MKFIRKNVFVEATQWFKNGDHPEDFSVVSKVDDSSEGQVVKHYLGNIEVKCEKCQYDMDVHGFLSSSYITGVVCPGDWIITNDGEIKGYYILDSDSFNKKFEHKFIDKTDSGISTNGFNFERNEDEIVAEILKHIEGTYGSHYCGLNEDIQVIDLILSIGVARDAFRANIIKYMARYGQKNGRNKEDLLKAAHYIILLLFCDFYRDKKTE